MRYRKKPVEVEAVRWTGKLSNEVIDFLPKGTHFLDDEILIPTPEGHMTARPGDYIIKGIKGEFYPCKPDIFEQTYEKVD